LAETQLQSLHRGLGREISPLYWQIEIPRWTIYNGCHLWDRKVFVDAPVPATRKPGLPVPELIQQGLEALAIASELLTNIDREFAHVANFFALDCGGFDFERDELKLVALALSPRSKNLAWLADAVAQFSLALSGIEDAALRSAYAIMFSGASFTACTERIFWASSGRTGDTIKGLIAVAFLGGGPDGAAAAMRKLGLLTRASSRPRRAKMKATRI